MSLARLVHEMKGDARTGKIAVVVGNINNELGFFELPKLKDAALHVTEKPRERILKAGYEILTFDHLALRSLTGKDTVSLQGR